MLLLVPDSVGLPFKISFNQQHYLKDKEGQKVWRFGPWVQMETLVHELGHHCQQMLGEDPFVPNSRVTHNKKFRAKMMELGIYCDSEGAPVGKPMNFDWIKWFAKEQEKKEKEDRH